MDYLNFFGFKEPPFRIGGHPDYYFSSDVHEEGMDALKGAIAQKDGITLLTGPAGTGKTLLVKTLMAEQGNTTAHVFLRRRELLEYGLLRAILEAIGISPTGKKEGGMDILLGAFIHYLKDKYKNKQRFVVVVCDAQTLPDETLEEIRILAGLESGSRRLFSIVLEGRPGLEKRLNEPDLNKIQINISTKISLSPLSFRDTQQYIAHRISIASAKVGGTTAFFSRPAVKKIFSITKGTPKSINDVCVEALTTAFEEGDLQIDKKHVAGGGINFDGLTGVLFSRNVVLTTLIILLFCAGIVTGYAVLPAALKSKRAEQTIASASQQIVTAKVEVSEAAAPEVKETPSPAVKPATTKTTSAVPSLNEALLSIDSSNDVPQDLQEKIKAILQKEEILNNMEAALSDRMRAVDKKERGFEKQRNALVKKETELYNVLKKIETKESAFVKDDVILTKKENELLSREKEIETREINLARIKNSITKKREDLKKYVNSLNQKEADLNKQQVTLNKKEAVAADHEKKLATLKAELDRLKEKKRTVERGIELREAGLIEKEKYVTSKLRELAAREQNHASLEANLVQKEAVLAKREEMIDRERKELGRANKKLVSKKARTVSPQATKPTAAQPSNNSPAASSVAVSKTNTAKYSRPIDLPRPFYLPVGKTGVTIIHDKNVGYAWKGSRLGRKLKSEFTCKWPFGSGIFLIGMNRSGKTYVLDYNSFTLGGPYKKAFDVKGGIYGLKPGSIIPAAAYLSGSLLKNDAAALAAEVKVLINSWAETWRTRDSVKHISYYGSNFAAIDIREGKEPGSSYYTNEQLGKIRKGVFEKAGAVSLSISDPMCVVGFGGKRSAAAIFRQEFESDRYSDSGIKILYFSSESGKWKIVAKAWKSD